MQQVYHTFDITNEQLKANPSLRDEIEDWLQFEYGPMRNYQHYFQVYDCDDHFESLLTAMFSVRSTEYIPITERVHYEGKHWTFDSGHITEQIRMGTQTFKTVTEANWLTIAILDDAMAIDFKLRFC